MNFGIDLQDQLRPLLLGPPLLTLAVSESLTSGFLQSAIGSRSGASDFFSGGMTAYSIDQKVTHLGVDRREAERCAAVSGEVARQMALGVCDLFQSAIGLSTTGFAEPDPAAGITTPCAFWAIAHVGAGSQSVVRDGFVEKPGLTRTAVQQAVTEDVLQALLEYLTAFRKDR